MAWYSITPAHTCTMQNTHTRTHTLSLSLTHADMNTHTPAPSCPLTHLKNKQLIPRPSISPDCKLRFALHFVSIVQSHRAIAQPTTAPPAESGCHHLFGGQTSHQLICFHFLWDFLFLAIMEAYWHSSRTDHKAVQFLNELLQKQEEEEEEKGTYQLLLCERKMYIQNGCVFKVESC